MQCPRLFGTAPCKTRGGTLWFEIVCLFFEDVSLVADACRCFFFALFPADLGSIPKNTSRSLLFGPDVPVFHECHSAGDTEGDAEGATELDSGSGANEHLKGFMHPPRLKELLSTNRDRLGITQWYEAATPATEFHASSISTRRVLSADS